MIRLRISEAATISFLEQAEYYTQKSGPELAARWEAAVRRVLHSLLKMPERGTRCRFKSAGLENIRWVLIPDFPRHITFYRYAPEESTIVIVQIAHAARDLESLLSSS